MRNLLTDIDGVRVGNADDTRIATGVTAVIFDEPAVASLDIRGGGPGERDAALLDPVNTVERVDALFLSGGSAFGLDAGGGVQSWLAEQGRGFPVGTATIPIAPGAILFDMMNGGDKSWGRFSPYRDLGYQAAASATGGAFALGTSGAGYGASTATLKGGLGSASAIAPNGAKVAALIAVNAIGSVTIGEGPHFWAAPFEQNEEFGGLGTPARFTPEMLTPRIKGGRAASATNTTIGIVLTDAILTKAQAKRLAIIANTGMARAIYPVHAPLDGDALFVAATGKVAIDPMAGLTELGAIAANVVARATARGVYEATAFDFAGAQPAWKDRFG